MKNFIKLLFGTVLIATVFVACKKDENKVYYTGATNPVLTASSTAPMVLLIANKNNPAVTFNWTNPNYQFTTGPSSQDVNYILQIDTTNSNFTNPGKSETAIAKDLTFGFTVGELNAKLLAMGLIENVPHNMEMRIKATLANSSIPVYSNVIKIIVIPYLDVVFPVPANLYITGSATPLSWQCGCATDGTGASQKFTKISSSKFELTIALSANNSYLFLPAYGSWAAKYGFTGSNNANSVNGDDFKPDGGDMKAPATSGIYKITVDFKTGKWTVQ